MPPGLNVDAHLADAELRRALAGRQLVTFDRFTSAGRTCVLGPKPVGGARPELAVGYYSSWPSARVARLVLAAEERSGWRDGESKHRWLADLGCEVAVACRGLRGKPLFAAWYEEPTLARIAKAVGGELLTIPAAVRATLEDKTRLDALLRSAGVRERLCIPTVDAAGTPSYAEITASLGDRLVVQSAITSGGRGTVFVNDRARYEETIRRGGPWRISQFVDGFSSNITVLTVPKPRGCAVYVDQPSHKPVGIPKLGISVAKGAGNDWSPPWPRALSEELVEAIARIGEYLYTTYRLIGLWGVDAIWADGRVVINEINVRNQGTTELSGVNQILRGLPPLLVAHLTVLAGGSVSWLPSADEFNTETVSRAASGGRGPFYVKLRNLHQHPVTPGPGWQGSGVYRLDDSGELIWLRAGAHPTDGDLDKNEVLLANSPAAGVACAPGAELGTAEGVTTRPLFSAPAELSPLGAALHRTVLSAFIRREPERTQL